MAAKKSLPGLELFAFNPWSGQLSPSQMAKPSADASSPFKPGVTAACLFRWHA